MATPIPFETLVHDTRCGSADPVRAVVRSAAELAALGLRGEVPEVDFTRGSLIVVALGRRPDASVGVEISAVVREGSSAVRVTYAQTETGSPADVISYPAHIVRVERLDAAAAVEFVAQNSPSRS